MNTLLLGKAFIQQMPTTYSIPRIVLRAETGKDKAHPMGACSVGRCWANAHTQGLGTARYISSLQSKDLSLWMNNLRHGKRVNCISKGATKLFQLCYAGFKLISGSGLEYASELSVKLSQSADARHPKLTASETEDLAVLMCTPSPRILWRLIKQSWNHCQCKSGCSLIRTQKIKYS